MKIVEAVIRATGLIAAGLLLVMMLMTVVNVVARYIFHNPITGTFELTELLMVAICMGIAWTGLKKRHIAVDLLVAMFKPRAQSVIGIFTLFASVVTGAVITWRCFEYTFRVVLKDNYIASILLPVPLFPFYIIFDISFALLTIVVFSFLVQKIGEVVKR